MLSDDALKVAIALRQNVGPDKKGAGPDVKMLVSLVDMTSEDLRRAVDELKGLGFVKLELRIGTAMEGIPDDFRDVAGVSVLEPMQAFLDQLDEQ